MALDLIHLFGWTEYFSSFQIYHICKVNHMNAIKKELNFDNFSDVLFFDDEYRNIIDTKKIGVEPIHVEQHVGVNSQVMMMGLKKFDS